MQNILLDFLHIPNSGDIMDDKIGVIKEVDNLGRLVIPKEMRETFKLKKYVEIVVTKDGILVRNPKYEIIEKKDADKN